MSTERWLVTGASGQLGGHAVRLLAAGGVETLLALVGQQPLGRAGVNARHIDLADTDALRATVAGFRPTHVLHLGALTAVGACHERPLDADRINVGATRALAEATAAVGGHLTFASTDMVFGGDRAPYAETDTPAPLSVYGASKGRAEQTLAACDHVLTVRIPLMFGFPVHDRETTFVQQMRALRSGEPLRLFTDEYRTPVWLPDAARALIGLARRRETGLLHIAGPQRLSRFELVARCAELLGIAAPRLVPVSRLDVAAAEPRPADLSLDARRCHARHPDLVPGPLRPAVFADRP